MTVNKMVGDTFDAIVELFPKIIPDAKINSDGWWSFIGPYGKSKVKFNQNKSLGILDHQYVDEESSWNIPMRIIQNGNFSEVVIILTKPEQSGKRGSRSGNGVKSVKNQSFQNFQKR